MKKILIFYTSVGLGHKFLAQNIGWHLSESGFEVRLEDIGKVETGLFGKISIWLHSLINKYLPFVWGWMYRWWFWVAMPFRLLIAGFNYKRAQALIEQFDPDLIVATQTSASAVVAYLKKQGFYKNQFAIAFSDYHLHRFWLYKQADFYLANIDKQKQEMMALGIPANKIFVCGITLKPKAQVDAGGVKQKFNIQPEEKVVLIGTGSLGVGFKDKDLAELSKLPNSKIIFVCGKNTELLKKVETLNYQNVIILGFYTPMDELYAIADIFVGKPGGLSTAESLQWNLPLLITFALPGQEKKNMQYLTEHNLVMARGDNLISAVEQELKTHAFKIRLQTNVSVLKIINRSDVLVEAVRYHLKKYLI